MEGIVYILQDMNGRFYIGSTTDIGRRLGQHESGHTRTTSRMRRPRLVFQQIFEDLGIARRTERRLKKYHRRDFLEKIIADGIIRKQ